MTTAHVVDRRPRLYLVPPSDQVVTAAGSQLRCSHAVDSPGPGSLASMHPAGRLRGATARGGATASRRILPQRRSSVRLTRRGRILVRVFLVFVAAVVALAVAVQTQAATAPKESAPHSVLVAPGDTMWSIAAEHVGSASVPAAIHTILDLNNLDDVQIEPGQRLLLP